MNKPVSRLKRKGLSRGLLLSLPKYLRFVLCAISVTLINTASEAAPARNVLLIIADDMSDAIGSYGHPIVKTPNIDKLAKKGVRFANAHANYALCNPSRTSFLSGVYPETAKVFGNDLSVDDPRHSLGPSWVMMQEHFDNNGYFTARVGKVAHEKWESRYRWDLNTSDAVGPNPPYSTVKSGGVGRWRWKATTQLDENTTDGRNVRYIADVIEQHKDEPFFIAMGFRQPHTPWVVPKRYFDLYPTAAIKLPREMGEPGNDRNDIPAEAITVGTEWSDLANDSQRRQAIAAAYAAHSFVDAGVGVLLETLTRLDLWKNTVVVFISDHGYLYGEHGGLVGKEALWAEATRIPFILVAPGKSVNKVSNKSVELVNLYPTLAELCGLPVPSGLEGSSMVSLLDNPSASSWNRIAYSVVTDGQMMGYSVKNTRYRYTKYAPVDLPDTLLSEELYDLGIDSGEYLNRISKPGYVSVLASMKAQLASARRRPSAE